MNPLGVVQGRLLPPVNGTLQAFPRDGWEAEFPAAAAIGLDHLEWIVDEASVADNPILDRAGRASIADAVEESGVAVLGICGDVFRDRPLIGADGKTLQDLLDLLDRCAEGCAAVGGRILMIPLVDRAAIAPGQIRVAAEVLAAAAAKVARHGVTTTIECSLPPDKYAELLDELGGTIRVTFDIGDCASLGHDPAEELASLASWLECVHVKDRLLGGSSVELGSGVADLETVFTTLSRLEYHGPVTLQVARGPAGSEEQVIAGARDSVRTLLGHSEGQPA